MRPPVYLLCVDKGPESLPALKLVCARARARGGEVRLLHVVPPPDFQGLQTVANHMQAELRAEAEANLAALKEQAMAHGITPSTLLREGDVGEEILAAVHEQTDVSSLVLGVGESTSTRGRMAAWLAAELGRRLLIPLLLVPGNLTDEQLQALR